MATQTLPIHTPISLRRRVFRLALPAVGEQFLNMLVGLVDIYLLGHLAAGAVLMLGYGPAEGLASVGLANYLLWIVTTLYMAGAVGATALIARAVGAGEHHDANRFMRQSLVIGLVLGSLGLVILYAAAPLAMRLLGAEPLVADLGVSFLRITALSMPLAGVMFMLNAAMRGSGDTKTPLYIMGIVNGLNILISWLLVSGQFGLPAMGVVGAAWGTAVGRAMGGVIAVLVLLWGRGILKIDRLPRPDLTVVRRIMRVGIPTAAEMFVFQGALVIFARFITGLGTVPYAAHNTVITVESISFLPGFGFAIAATTLVGQSLGAKDAALARRSGHEAFFQGAIFMSFMGLLFVLFPELFLRMLVSDPAVVAAGVLPLRMVGVIQPLLAANFVYAGALRGAGDTRWPLLIKLIAPWFIRLPLALLLIPIWGLDGAWLAMSIDLAAQGVLAYWRFRGDRWERIKV
jgi:multidrug resistance protein, MATE family